MARMYGKTRREHYQDRLVCLKKERQSWEPAWRDICDHMIPYRAVWNAVEQKNRGEPKEGKIINNRPVRALSVLAAGMMAGITSPARQWFSLTTSDRELAEIPAVKKYLDQCREIIEALLQTSNWYNALSNGTYVDLGAIGTSAMFLEEESPRVVQRSDGAHLTPQIRFRPLPIGEYYLDVDHRGDVDTCYRELAMTTRQMAGKFGLKACSQRVRDDYEKGKYETTHRVIHAIMPNSEREPGKLGPRGKSFLSCWWEEHEPRKGHFLHEGGYDFFPILAPRWFTRTGDTYGRGPGWEVRGSCRFLQFMERRFMRMVDLAVTPPMNVIGSIKRASLVPGDLIHHPEGGKTSFEPAYEVPRGAMEVCQYHIQRAEERIEEAMHVDLWQALLHDERKQPATATEIEAREKEKMLVLGPVLENLDDGLLEPAIERIYRILERRNALPEMPPELHGRELKVEFISIMHQMQKATNLAGYRMMAQEVAALASLRQEAVDKLNIDIFVDELARISGIRPDAIRSQDEVDADRRTRAEMEQQQQQGEAMMAMTQGAANLSKVDPQRLQDIGAAISPVANAQGAAPV